jgi:septum formation protein
VSPLQRADVRLVLASGSRARARLLRAVGLDFVVRPVPVDEALIKEALRADGIDGIEAAVALASVKGERASLLAGPDEVVIAADQLLETEQGDWPDKPETRAALVAHLLALAGASHRLHTVVVLYRGGARVWHHVASPRLRIRALRPGFVERYVDAAGDALLGCVGGYQLEALGPHVLASVEGDAFAVQGLPLLSLLEQLRLIGAVEG